MYKLSNYSIVCNGGGGDSIVFIKGALNNAIFAYPQLTYFSAISLHKSLKRWVKDKFKCDGSLCDFWMTKEEVEAFMIYLAQVYYELEFKEETSYYRDNNSYFNFQYLQDVDYFSLEVCPIDNFKCKNKNLHTYFDIILDKKDVENLFFSIKNVYDAYCNLYNKENVEADEAQHIIKKSNDIIHEIEILMNKYENLSNRLDELNSKYHTKKKQILLESEGNK